MAEPAKTPVATDAAETPKAVAAKQTKPVTTKAKFRVISGKHQNEDGTFARQGDVVVLETAVAASFTNKFARVVVDAPVEDIDAE